MITEFSGIYAFCAKCPTRKNCCSRVAKGGSIDLPLIFPEDTRRIEKFTRKHRDSFSVNKLGSACSERNIKTSLNGCTFYQNGKCTIYPVRPIDCRLFPLDIIEQANGRLAWIVYRDLCPIKFNIHPYLEQAKILTKALGKNLRAYAKSETPGMDKAQFMQLEEIDMAEL